MVSGDFSFEERGGVTFLLCRELTRLGVTHGFTTRLGGVSKEPFDSLNLSYSPKRSDSPENVRENYNRVLRALGYTREEAIITNQTHTSIVYSASPEMRGAGFAREGFSDGVDGLVSNLEDTLLAVTVADCQPVLLYDKNSGAVGAVHSGWAGTIEEISVNALNLMRESYGTNPRDVVAVLGASIGVGAYEVGPEFFSRFAEKMGDFALDCFEKYNEKYKFNLPKLNEKILLRAGIKDENLYSAGICTYTESDYFFSYRRQGSERGSMAALIGK